MRRIFEIVGNNPLFDGISYDEFDKMLHCIEAREQCFSRGDIVLMSGDRVSLVGLVVSGRVRVVREDAAGNRSILTELAAPELFGEVFACAGVDHSPVTIEAVDDCRLLFINYRRILSICRSSCSFHTRLIENMLGIVARKTLMLNRKLEVLSKRTTRGKLLAFFETQHLGKGRFVIPYSREELASYLCVDRSAMSSELGRMRDEGIIRFEKNEFELL